jgi:hypothetical protein
MSPGGSQTMKIHTSCSKPLNVGDTFGSVEVVGLETTEGGVVTLGSEITFYYEVRNLGGSPVSNVHVVDSFGNVPGSPIASIAVGGSAFLTREITLTEPVSNNVVATVGDPGNPDCEDSGVVPIITPPPPAVPCSSSIVAFLVKYTGPTITDMVTVGFKGDNTALVNYVLPGGLPTGTVLSMPAQNGFTIDATALGEDKLGTKTSVYFEGELTEVFHTSCSCKTFNFVPGEPVCLDSSSPDNTTGSKGAPSPLFELISLK